MTTSLTAALREKYPRLIPERFGFECDDGWLGIIDDFLAVVDRELPASGTFRLRQVKEKLGGLRIYFDVSPDTPAEAHAAIDDAYDRASARSYKICEICGARGRFSNRQGFLTVVCEEHQVDDFGDRAIPKEPESDYIRRLPDESWQRYDFDLDAFVATDPPEGWE
jgi:hypothetical protein